MIVFGLPSGKLGNVQHRLQETEMPSPAREGKMRSELREAILAGFDSASLDLVFKRQRHASRQCRDSVPILPRA